MNKVYILGIIQIIKVHMQLISILKKPYQIERSRIHSKIRYLKKIDYMQIKLTHVLRQYVIQYYCIPHGNRNLRLTKPNTLLTHYGGPSWYDVRAKATACQNNNYV